MNNYAVYDSNINCVINVVVAESAEVAAEVCGKQAIPTDGVPWINWWLFGDTWCPPSPFSSWTWDGAEWVAPVSKPDDSQNYYWDESSQIWILADNYGGVTE
jgi:hypothetical protein